jgi:nucleoside-diphosphate-sugar epimerase
VLVDIDAVAHLAAIVGDPACAMLPELATTTNLGATELLADLCQEGGIARLVLASTCSVYGAGETQLTEDSPVNPVSHYAETKVQAEKALLERASSEFAPIVLRFATLYGLGPRLRFDLVANLLMARAVREGAIGIYGGDQWRPFLHVADAALALARALALPDTAAGRVYNVGSGAENCRLLDLGKLIAELAPGTSLTVDASAHDQRTYHVAFDRFARTAGFRPERTLRDGLSELRRFLLTNPDVDIADPRWDNARWLATTSATARGAT